MRHPIVFAAAFLLGFASIGRAELLYVTEADGTVVRYDTSSPSTVPTIVVSGLVNPGSLAFDSSGNLFIASQSAPSIVLKQDQILKFTPSGTLSTFASNLNYIQGLAFNAPGDLYASSAGTSTILRFTPDGAVNTFATNLVGPTGLAFDQAGDLYVSLNANQNRVVRITPEGSASTFTLGVSDPLGLAFDSSGVLYIANPGFADVYTVAPGGAHGYIPLGMPVTDVAVDSAGNLFFTSGGASSGVIGVITPDGKVSTFATTSSVPRHLALAPSASAVPEPSSLVLAAVGFVLLSTGRGVKRGRRKV